MKGGENGDGSGPSIHAYGSQSQRRYGSRFCDSCWNQAAIHVDGTPVCEIHARASGVIGNE